MGMPIAFHWDIKKQIHAINAGPKSAQRSARLVVLFYLTLCANTRLRCWPSMDTIARDTGVSLAAATEAKDWLLKHDALVLVPFALRQGEEKEYPKRQHIYQLTGYVKIDGKVHPYILMSDELRQAVMKETNALKIVSESETSETETSDSEGKGYTSSEDDMNTTALSAKNAEGVETDLSVKGKQPATPKTKTPKPQLRSPLSPDERDALFDAVILHVFKVRSPEEMTEAKESDNAGTRAGMISNWLAQGCEKIQNKKVGRISRPATPEHVQKFASWYASAKPRISIPKDAEKFIEAWREWASINHARSQPRPQPAAPTAQPLTDDQRKQRQAELAAQRNGASA
jgi:hypothetical protein